MIKFMHKALRMKTHLNGNESCGPDSAIVSLAANDIPTHENSATSSIKSDNQNTPHSVKGWNSHRTALEDVGSIGNGLDSAHSSFSNGHETDTNEKADLKPEDFELLEKLREANRLIEADCKSLSFSGDGSGCRSTPLPAPSSDRKSSSHEKSLSTSSTGSSAASSAAGHRKSSVSSIVNNLLSRQNSASSDRSDCSHKIGVPCSCPPSNSPDIMEEVDKEVVCDSWSTWREITDNWEQHKDRQSFLKEMVRKGIPSHFRGLVWPLLCGAWNSPEKSNYKTYLGRPSKFEKFIRRDVSRTYPSHDMFRQLDGPGQESLFNVIKAYSLLDPEVGYCQGSAFVAGLLLMQMPEEDAFAVFVRVMQKYGLRELYKPSMAKIELCIYQLECMIQDKDPSLYQHFQAHGMFASTFATPWFLSLFATSLPLPLSCRVLDIFLLEGMSSIMTLSYAMLEISSQELKTRDMEEMIKLLGKELPRRLEEDPDVLFNASFRVKFCPKKMKKLERDYTGMKTKENEDNIERKRLRTENKLLRQRIERLEKETSELADRLVQDQVKYANQEEELYTLRRRHSLSLQSHSVGCRSSNEDATTDGATAVSSSSSSSSSSSAAKELQARIDELVTREVGYLAEMHDLKARIAELEKKNLESHGGGGCGDVSDLQQQLVLSKLREAEMNTSARELERRVVELDRYWQKHQELIGVSGDDSNHKPKVQKAKVQLLAEELLSVKLREANTTKDVMELKLKIMDLETKNHINERLIKKLEEEKEALRDSLSELESTKASAEDQMRGLRRQLSTAESKQQNDELMTKIKDAETSQAVAELRQKIAQLEIQNQELLTAEKLYKGETLVDNPVDIDAKIEELHLQIVQLRELKRSHGSGSRRRDTSGRNYSEGESDSDFDDFDAVRYKLRGSTCSLLGGDKIVPGSLDLGKANPRKPSESTAGTGECGEGVGSASPGSSSISLEDELVHGSSTSDSSEGFREDIILAGTFDVVRGRDATSTNPDVVLDSVFDGSLDAHSGFAPSIQSSPRVSPDSCLSSSSSAAKRPGFHELRFGSGEDRSPGEDRSHSGLEVFSLDDPDKTPTNEILNDSGISTRTFAFGSDPRRGSAGRGKGRDPPLAKIPDILSDGYVPKVSSSSLVAGLDLPVEDKTGDRTKLEDFKVIQEKNLSRSLDVLSARL